MFMIIWLTGSFDEFIKIKNHKHYKPCCSEERDEKLDSLDIPEKWSSYEMLIFFNYNNNNYNSYFYLTQMLKIISNNLKCYNKVRV